MPHALLNREQQEKLTRSLIAATAIQGLLKNENSKYSPYSVPLPVSHVCSGIGNYNSCGRATDAACG